MHNQGIVKCPEASNIKKGLLCLVRGGAGLLRALTPFGWGLESWRDAASDGTTVSKAGGGGGGEKYPGPSLPLHFQSPASSGRVGKGGKETWGRQAQNGPQGGREMMTLPVLRDAKASTTASRETQGCTHNTDTCGTPHSHTPQTLLDNHLPPLPLQCHRETPRELQKVSNIHIWVTHMGSSPGELSEGRENP